MPDGTTYLRWAGLFEFLVSPDGRRIEYRQLHRATRESFNTYLLSQVLSFCLLAFGVEPLHGTVVVIDGRAVAFLGDCGYGKSTLAAAFLTRGFRILTDDLIALERHGNRYAVHPGPPRLKLFPSIAQRLLGEQAQGKLMNPWTSKLVLPLDTGPAAQEPVPLEALYVLSDPEALQGRRQPRISIKPLAGREAFLEVVRAAFNLIQVDKERLANQFDTATRLTVRVPVRLLTYPRTLGSLPSVCDKVLADLTHHRSSPTPA